MNTSEPMSAERLAELRETADLARHDPYAIVTEGGEVVELVDRVRRAEAALARLRALHSPLFNSASALTPRPLCAGDMDEDWPCATIRALEGAAE